MIELSTLSGILPSNKLDVNPRATSVAVSDLPRPRTSKEVDRKLVVMMDIDGVCANFFDGFQQLASKMFGIVPKQEKEQLNWSDVGLTQSQLDLIGDYIRHGPNNFWHGLEPMPDLFTETCDATENLEALWDLQGLTDMYFVTKRPGTDARRQSWEWLNDRLEIGFPQVITTTQKDAVARALKADYLLDDHVQNIKLVEQLGTCVCYLYKATQNQEAWNKHFTVNNIAEFAECVLSDRNNMLTGNKSVLYYKEQGDQIE